MQCVSLTESQFHVNEVGVFCYTNKITLLKYLFVSSSGIFLFLRHLGSLQEMQLLTL